MLTDIEGLYTDWPDRDSLVTEIDTARWPDRCRLESGMVPKMRPACGPSPAGCPAPHVIDGRVPHCVLVELFTNEGTGTRSWAVGTDGRMP